MSTNVRAYHAGTAGDALTVQAVTRASVNLASLELTAKRVSSKTFGTNINVLKHHEWIYIQEVKMSQATWVMC